MKQDVLRRNNVKVTGNGSKTMLFAHGFGCDQNMWRFIVPAFENEYKIVLFDYVGCGKSDLSAYNQERYNSLNGYAQDILEICEVLDLNDVVLVAHSVSGMIGALACIEESHRFSEIIFVCPSPRYINDADYLGGFSREEIEGLLDVMDNNFIGWASFLAPVVMKNPENPELTEELEKSFCSIDPVITRNFARVTFFSDNRKDLHKIKVRSLILQCSDDAIAPDEVGSYMQKNLNDATLKRMRATGHCPHMSNPSETIELMQEFLVAG